MNRVEVARLLNQASESFRQDQEALAKVLQDENQARVSCFRSELPQGTSVAAAERLADINSLHLANERINITGRLKSLEEEINHYRFMIKYDLYETI